MTGINASLMDADFMVLTEATMSGLLTVIVDHGSSAHVRTDAAKLLSQCMLNGA